MPIPLLERKKAMAVGIETNYGEAVPIAECSLVLLTEISVNPYQGNTVQRERMREYLGGFAEVNTGPNTQVQVTVPWSGSGTAPEIGTAVTAPGVGKLLRGCKMIEVEDLDAGEVQYQRISDEGESLTIYYRHDGQEQCIKGSRGTVTGVGQTGSMPTISITFTGLYERPQEVAGIEMTVEDWADEIPVNFQNTTKFNVLGHEAIGQSFNFDLANTVTYRNLPNHEGVHITDSTPTGQVTFQAPRLGEFNIFEKTESHQLVTTGEVEFEHGTVPGNIVGVRGPKVQLKTPGNQDTDGITHYQCDMSFLPIAGNDELVLFFK